MEPRIRRGVVKNELIIGANTVVTKHILNNSIAVGNLIKNLKTRF